MVAASDGQSPISAMPGGIPMHIMSPTTAQLEDGGTPVVRCGSGLIRGVVSVTICNRL